MALATADRGWPASRGSEVARGWRERVRIGTGEVVDEKRREIAKKTFMFATRVVKLCQFLDQSLDWREGKGRKSHLRRVKLPMGDHAKSDLRLD